MQLQQYGYNNEKQSIHGAKANLNLTLICFEDQASASVPVAIIYYIPSSIGYHYYNSCSKLGAYESVYGLDKSNLDPHSTSTSLYEL